LGVSFRAFNIDFFLIPKNEEVVSHQVRACTAKQHVLRSSYQTKIWLNAHIPKSAVGSPLEHGWKDGKFGLEPILFEGQMSSDFLKDLVCTCKGRSVCSKGHLIWSIAHRDILGIK
jgi:hypothetical protein